MRYWKFSQKIKLKQKFFDYSEKEVGNFFQDWNHSVRPRKLRPPNIFQGKAFILTVFSWREIA